MKHKRGWWWNGKRVRAMLHPEAMDCTAPRVLKIDVDKKRGLSVLALARRMEKANRRLMYLIEERSPSGSGWHRWVAVWPVPETAVEMVALQLLCGSDPHREAYNLNRALAVDRGTATPYWAARWNVFYKKERTGT